MSDAASSQSRPRGLGTLPPRRSAEDLATKPPIEDLSALIIEDLVGADYDAFLDALGQ